MTLTRKLIIAFWIFIVAMSIWEFYNYNAGLSQKAIEHPTQQHFYFLPPTAKTTTPAGQAHAAGADVQQTDFQTSMDTPSTGHFTCHVTLKNVGSAKATGVQIMVRPYRGVSNYDEDGGQQILIVVDDNNPISKLGEYLTFPDLAPGQSATEDVVFLSRADFKPGKNPKPDIIFESEKPAAAANKAPPLAPIIHRPDD